MSVYAQRVALYDPNIISSAVENAFRGLKMDLAGKHSVIIKPNLVRASKPETAIVTHPVVVEGIINALRAWGVNDITVAEQSSIGVDTMHAFEVAGYTEMAKRTGVPLADLGRMPAKKVSWKYGEVELPEAILDSDLYISVPKLKTHCHTTVTFGAKNQWALLPKKARQDGHQQNLHEHLVELAKIVQPHLTIVDGIEGMEGLGPTNGTKAFSRVIIAGNNMFETDVACCRMMGIDPFTSKHLTIAHDEGLWEGEPEFAGTPPRIPQFEPPDPGPRRKLNLYAWRNERTCALAEHAFEDALHHAMRNPKYWFTFMPKFLAHVTIGRLDYVRGSNPTIPDDHGAVLWLCDCEHKYVMNNGTICVKGCPPSAEDILDAITKMPVTQSRR